MKRKRLIVWIVILLTVLAGGAFMLLRRPAAAETAGTAARIVTVEVLTQSEGIEISGNIEPANSADLAFPAAGYISQVSVAVGDSVQAGQVVAVLEDSQQRYNLAEVDVELDAEQITGSRRNQDLLNLKREMIQSDLEDTRLKSTIGGIVTEVNAEAGDYVTAQQAGSEKDIVVRIIDRSSMTATVEVDELDAPSLSEGQDAVFQFDAYPDLEISGFVSDVPLEARQTSQGIAVLDTEVSIPDPPKEILPNFTFSGEIVLEADEQILLIPEEAVIERGTRSIVLRLTSEEGTAQTPPGTEDSQQNGQLIQTIKIPVPGNRASGSSSGATVIGGGSIGVPGSGSGGSGLPGGGMGGMGAPGGGQGGGFASLTAGTGTLPEGMTVRPAPVTVSEYGGGKVRVEQGLSEGDQIVLPSSGTAETTTEEAGSANVMSLLGIRMPGGGPGGGGR